MFTKESHDENIPFDQIDISKKNKRRSGANIDDTPVPLWPEGKPISDAKFADLKSIYHLIPSDVLPFYQNLRPDPRIEEDLEGFNGSLDFELED